MVSQEKIYHKIKSYNAHIQGCNARHNYSKPCGNTNSDFLYKVKSKNLHSRVQWLQV
jgi:hypothetical protein